MRNTLASVSDKVLSITREGNVGVWGQFLNKDAQPLGPEFKITDEPQEVYCGWTMVASGGNEFAVTYVAWTGGPNENWRVLRTVTPEGVVSPPRNVVPIFTEANFSERCGITWTPTGWVISFRLPGSTFPVPAVIRVRHDGLPESQIVLSTSNDHYNGGAVAYGNGFIGLCGYVKWSNAVGGTWGLVLDAESLGAIGPMMALDSGPACEDHAITYTPDGHFLSHWSRNAQQTTSVIKTDNTFEPINLKTSGGSYCIANLLDTCLTVIKAEDVSLSARFLSNKGIAVNTDQKLANWDGIIPDYHPAVCAVSDGWVVNAQFGEGLRFFSVKNVSTPPPDDIGPILKDIVERLTRIEKYVKQGRVIEPIV